MVEDITKHSESEEEEDETKIVEVGPSNVQKKRKVQDSIEITLPYLPNALVTM